MITREIKFELAERKGDTKTFPVVLSTENPVRRKDWERGDFDEVLSHAPNAIDLSRAPLPMLESHNHQSMPIGVVDSLRVLDGELRGEAKFGSSARAKEIAADVEAGIIRSLSVGYSIEKVTEKRSGDVAVVTATRWTPHEVSAVSIPADKFAGFRSKHMEDEQTPTIPTTKNRDASALVERERCLSINRSANALDIEPAFAAALIRDGVSLADAQARMIEERAKAPPIVGDGYPTIEPVTGQRRWGAQIVDDFREAAADAILLRAGVPVSKPHPGARDVSASVRDLARICLSREGKTAKGSDADLLKRAQTTSDFPLILGDALGKGTRRGYEDEPASHRAWVSVQPVRDFREQTRVILGAAPELLGPINEHGEYEHGPLDEDGSVPYAVAKFGRIVSLTWEVLKNDDLGSFMRIQPAMGQAARRKEADLVYAMFAENAAAGPTMQDGQVLFHADHGNLVTAGAFSAALLGAGRTLLRRQTAVGGGYMSLVPKFLIVPPELETEAEILLASATTHVATGTEADTPKWLTGLSPLVVEPRLPDGAVYLAADSSQIDTIELGLLDENIGGPSIFSEQAFESDIMRWKVRHVAGARVLDWRGLVKVPIS